MSVFAGKIYLALVLVSCFLEVVTWIEGKDLSFKTLSQVKRGRSQPVLCCWGGCKKEPLVLRTKSRLGLVYQVLEL